ncbi:MAG: IS30 family transposase, partial [Phascolarctobacterium sp.]|nr:IS30 family transposase [Phascolarctobacterium sp.]
RPQNERSNGLYRRYAPKGQSMDNLSDEDVEHASDLICGLPRKELGYRTSEELFDAFLDEIYTA